MLCASYVVISGSSEKWLLQINFYIPSVKEHDSNRQLIKTKHGTICYVQIFSAIYSSDDSIGLIIELLVYEYC